MMLCKDVAIYLLYFSVLWTVYGECENYYVIKTGHKGAILELNFNTDGR